MSTAEDTNAIDDKKTTETDSTTTTPDFKGFITNYISSIVFTIGIAIFCIGGLGLYTTKVAQSNILPDNIELAPYTVFDRVVKDMPVDMNIMRPTFWAESKDTVSQKAVFNSVEYLDSFSDGFLCYLKKNANPNGGLFANAPLFFSHVYDNLIAKNFLAINTIFFNLSYLPEPIIMFLYGIFGIFIWIGLYFFNVCISIFYHFINIPELFRTTDETDPSKWETTENISFARFVKFLIFFFIWIPIGLFSTFVMPIIFTIYGLISPLFATYKIPKTNKTHGVMDFIKDTFAYKKFFFFILATLSLVSNGLKYLGPTSIIGIIVAVLFAYFMGLYNNEIPEAGNNGFTPKIRQNMKQSNVEAVNLSNPKLVEICKPIPVINAELDKKIKAGTTRQTTKSKNKGGMADELDNYDMDDATPNSVNTIDTIPSNIIKTDTNTISTKDTQKNPLTSFNNVMDDAVRAAEYSKNTRNKYNLIKQEINDISNQLPQENTPLQENVTPAIEPVTEVLEPVTEVLEPATEVLEPATPVIEPATPVIEPATPVIEPATEVLEPATEVLEPATPVIEPATPIIEPATEVLEPATPVIEPATPVIEPSTEVSEPSTSVSEPVTEVSEPVQLGGKKRRGVNTTKKYNIRLV